MLFPLDPINDTVCCHLLTLKYQLQPAPILYNIANDIMTYDTPLICVCAGEASTDTPIISKMNLNF